MIYLDTHIVVWIYSGVRHRLSDAALACIEKAPDVRISPMVRLELQYLHEIGRASEPPAQVLDNLGARIGLQVCQSAFSAVAIEAENINWTRDPFDRIIVAQASLHDAVLVTRDQLINEHYAHAIQ